MRFENQVAVVTGAGRGIGHAIALRLASEGARVACVSRTEANAKKTADEINAARPDTAKAYAVDVADHAAVQKIGGQILDDFGKIDILVNNAGVRRDGLNLGMSMEDWDMVINTNLKGAFNFVQATERVMIKQRSGRIINISSVIGMIGNAGQTNYAASKAGLIGFTKSLARELASRRKSRRRFTRKFRSAEQANLKMSRVAWPFSRPRRQVTLPARCFAWTAA